MKTGLNAHKVLGLTLGGPLPWSAKALKALGCEDARPVRPSSRPRPPQHFSQHHPSPGTWPPLSLLAHLECVTGVHQTEPSGEGPPVLKGRSGWPLNTVLPLNPPWEAMWLCHTEKRFTTHNGINAKQNHNEIPFFTYQIGKDQQV